MMMRQKSRRRNGLKLVEGLVLLLIGLLMLGMVLVWLGSGREQRDRLTCLDHLRRIGEGTLKYGETKKPRPLPASAIADGYGTWAVQIAPYFLIASIDITLILTIGTVLFDVPFNGPLLPLVMGVVMFLFVALGLGVLISTVSQNQAQAIQVALMTALPQIMLSGIIFPLSSMAPGIRWIGYLLPLTYFNIVAKGVMLRGADLSDLLVPLALLTLLGLMIFGLAVVAFSRQLRPARTRVAS